MDFQQIIIYIVNLYSNFLYYLQVCLKNVKTLKKEKIAYFSLDKVTCDNTDLTDMFINNSSWLLKDMSFSIDWSFNNISYISFYNYDTISYFPPYGFYDIQKSQPDVKIIAGLLRNNEDNNIINITTFIKKLAGPKQNFYKDHQFLNVTTRSVWGIQNKTLTIITSLNNFHFNLSEDNVLEL